MEEKISGWMKIIEKIQKNELKETIKNYDKKYLINKVEDFIKIKYNEKRKITQIYQKNTNLIKIINNLRKILMII